MDFEFHFTKEEEEFRKEVRAFIEENALKKPVKGRDRLYVQNRHPELYLKGRELQRKLGAKGWFAPNYPKEYGGGGLDVGHCVVLGQELARISDEGRWVGGTQVSGIVTGGIGTYGTEDQKKRIFTQVLRGEADAWECFTEPDAGSDEASMKSTAIREGDVYVINGQKIFVGWTPIGIVPKEAPEYLYWLAVSDPKGRRHENISAFFIPANLPGISYIPMDLYCASAGGQKWQPICEDVRCPAEYLIGEENKGWLVGQATLALEHGGGGSLVAHDTFILDFIEYCKKTLLNGQPISKDPRVQELLVDLYTEFQVTRLWGSRNFAMQEGQIPRIRYTGTQTSLHGKRFAPRLGKALLDIIGPQGLLVNEKLELLEGMLEWNIRHGDVTHPGGTPEVQQILMSRALGLGRSAGRAPT